MDFAFRNVLIISAFRRFAWIRAVRQSAWARRVLLVAGLLVSRHVLKRVFASIAMNPEMVLAVSIGWCALVAGAATAMGLSKEMGALVAGLSIAAYPYSIHVTAKTLPLRDFFLTLFFVSLGMKITAPTASMILPVLTMVAFVVASRFLSVYPLVARTGGGRRAAFIASLNLAQISEFSLVIASLGLQYGHISPGTVAATLYAMALTAVLSSYAIRYSHPLYLAWDRMLGGPPGAAAAPEKSEAAHYDIVLLGYHRAARALLDALEQSDRPALSRCLVIDFNPVSLEECRSRGVAGIFGDISSLETLKHAHLSTARVIVSTIPDLLLKGVDNVALARMCKSIAPSARFIATADDAAHQQRLQLEGADEAVRLYELAGAAMLAQTARLDPHGHAEHKSAA